MHADEAARLPGDMGPAMRALVPRQQLFVTCLLGQGSRINYLNAVRSAGYEGTVGSMKVLGHRMAHNEKVQAAMLEEARKRMTTVALAAVGVVGEAIESKKVDMKTRLRAAEMALDRGGLHSVHEQRLVRQEMSREEKLRLLVDYAKQTGQDPRALLGDLADVVEGDFKVLGSEPA